MNFCLLYSTEKVNLIEFLNETQSLSKTNEFVSGCKHQVKIITKKFKKETKIQFTEIISVTVFYKTEFLCLWYFHLAKFFVIFRAKYKPFT